MTLHSRPYIEMQCNIRLTTNCNKSYAGHDESVVEREAFKLGWRETVTKGHICPNCRIFLNNREFCKSEEQLPETD